MIDVRRVKRVWTTEPALIVFVIPGNADAQTPVMVLNHSASCVMTKVWLGLLMPAGAVSDVLRMVAVKGCGVSLVIGAALMSEHQRRAQPTA